MLIYPAIDLRDKKCVRLYQGQYDQETIYHHNPTIQAKNFIAAGAEWLHIVDLDAAKNPMQSQKKLIVDIIRHNPINIQVGGGIRDKKQIYHLLDQGAARVIIGSKAILAPQEVAEWFTIFGPERLVLALDIRFDKNTQPKVLMNAWQTVSHYSLHELIDYYQSHGLMHVLCTNIHLDGTLKGPDYGLYRVLLEKFPFIAMQASGGIQGLSDIIKLKQSGVSGAVIGQALYTQRFSLNEALSC